MAFPRLLVALLALALARPAAASPAVIDASARQAPAAVQRVADRLPGDGIGGREPGLPYTVPNYRLHFRENVESLLFERAGAGHGTVTAFFIGTQHNGSGNNLDNSVIRIYLDGSPRPAISGPMGLLMGTFAKPNFLTRWWGADTKGPFSPLWVGHWRVPLPYGSGVRVTIQTPPGAGTTGWGGYLQGEDGGDPPRGRYAVPHNAVVGTPAAPRMAAPLEEVTLLDARGRGAMFGWQFLFSTPGTFDEGGRCIEGDLRVYIDGEAVPRVQYTGTEDVFFGGFWGQGGVKHGESQGLLVQQHPKSGRQVDVWYRFWDRDPIIFNTAIKVTWKCGDDPPGTPVPPGSPGYNPAVGVAPPTLGAAIWSNIIYYTEPGSRP